MIIYSVMSSFRSWLNNLPKVVYQRMNTIAWIKLLPQPLRRLTLGVFSQQKQEIHLIHIQWGQDGQRIGQNLVILMMDIRGNTQFFLLYV